MTMSSKLRQRRRSAHGTQPPRLPTDLPPRIPNVGSNTQLRCLEQYQQHLHKIQQRQEKRNQEQEREEEAREKQVSIERQEEEEKQKRNLLELQLRQQEQELKQRQQIMQWQQELEQQQQQQKKHKVHTPVVLSPSSGLCTIFETSDSEDEGQEGVKETEEAEDESRFNACPDEEMQRHSGDDDSHCTTPPLESPQKDHEETDFAPDLPTPPHSPSESPELPAPLEFDWGKKADIVHHLINQTLLLTGDSYSPLLLLPGSTGGTLSPLESSLWPNLLPPLTPTSATVTSVSSFSPEAPGASAQGEWTVVELETHH